MRIDITIVHIQIFKEDSNCNSFAVIFNNYLYKKYDYEQICYILLSNFNHFNFLFLLENLDIGFRIILKRLVFRFIIKL